MIDIELIRKNPDLIKKAAKDKGLALDIDRILDVDGRRLKALQEVEEMRALHNKESDAIARLSGAEREEQIAKSKELKDRISHKEFEWKALEEELEELMVRAPTVPSLDTPVGKSDADNVEIHKWGEKKDFGFTPKDHIELGKDLDILDLERGAKVAGYRGYYLKNEGALLAMALMQYAFSKLVKNGYTPMIPPTLVKEYALFGSGYFKGKEYDSAVDEIYQVATSNKESTGEMAKDKKFLVGTAEPSLLAYYSDEVLSEKQLPMKLGGFSQCYRSEIGSYGKDTKGIFRVHEFMKVEQVILCKADAKEAERLQDEMLVLSREMHEELGIPYRQIIICTGDLGVGKYRQYDLEAWLPGMDRYGETGSASIFLDWQSRRLNVKYVDEEGNKRYVYMLNNTALPTPRILIAILENHQNEDGSVSVPEALLSYLPKGMKVIRR